MDDKEYKSIAKLIGDHFKSIIITEPGHDRPLPAEKIKNALAEAAIDIKIIKNDIEAFEYAYNNIDKKDILFVMGSHFLIGANGLYLTHCEKLHSVFSPMISYVFMY